MTKKIEGHDSSCFDAVKNEANDNLEYFKSDKSEFGHKISEYLSSIVTSIETLVPLMKEVEANSSFYDFGEEVKGNGYTSWIKISVTIAKHTLKSIEEITMRRSSYFFSKGHYLREVKAFLKALDSLCILMNYLIILISWSGPNRNLMIPQEEHTLKEIITSSDKYFDQACFYGRCLCLHFCDSMVTVMKAFSTLMASFSEIYYSDGKFIAPILTGSKYWINGELRGERLKNISQYGSADFCKNFLYMGEVELINRIPSLILPSLQVNKVIVLDPKPLVLENIYGKNIDIPVPSSHLGKAPVSLRLLSSALRIGMETLNNSRSGCKIPSKALILHCHGGGFVGHSSRSHECYLRQWAMDLDVPILSVDYALAPEAPFPRALEEIFYAYCWALSNISLLGATGEKIVFAGDSAGGNLVAGLMLMCLKYGVKKPDGIFLAYTPVNVSLDLSPSRLLTAIDPVLPLGLVISLIKAYATSAENYAKSTSLENYLSRTMLEPKGSKTQPLDDISHSNGNIEETRTSTESDMVASKPKETDQSNRAGVISGWVSFLSSKWNSLFRSASSEDQLDHEKEKELHLLVPLELIENVHRDPLSSPFFASDAELANFPPVKILTTDVDIFLDDSIEFAKKLKRIGVPVSLDILSGLPHGFLNLSLLSNEAQEGSKICSQRISELINDVADPPTMTTSTVETYQTQQHISCI